MPDISLTTVVVLCAAALAAGWIDAVVGGGGLLLLPALLLGQPGGTQAAYALGTNKAVAIVGTTGAAVTYARRAPVPVGTAVRIGLAALAGSTGGAFFAAGMSTEVLKPVIM
ncbi:TSUP family transporter, partial [Streptomyces minutiscleroticus]|uniref:TSUP family transporter n=1 Tax=Streptomyces minutiscleroticus TaxID=68238 RepID=UPI003329D3A2